jgi:hypothetical protein
MLFLIVPVGILISIADHAVRFSHVQSLAKGKSGQPSGIFRMILVIFFCLSLYITVTKPGISSLHALQAILLLTLSSYLWEENLQTTLQSVPWLGNPLFPWQLFLSMICIVLPSGLEAFQTSFSIGAYPIAILHGDIITPELEHSQICCFVAAVLANFTILGLVGWSCSVKTHGPIQRILGAQYILNYFNIKLTSLHVLITNLWMLMKMLFR